MTLRILSVAPPLLTLFFFSAFVVAIVNVTANCTSSSFLWTFNSAGQSPCTVAGYMIGTCYPKEFDLGPLGPGETIKGPIHELSNQCECSTVGYSIMSACVACQDRDPVYWSEYVANCTFTLPPSQFPNPVPAGIYVPRWVTLDVTKENSWDSEKARQAGDSPEYGPGAIFGPSGVYTSSAGAGPTSPSTPLHRGNGGAIAGGVIGGIAIISIAVVAIFYLRQRHSQATSVGVGGLQPKPNSGMVAQLSSGSQPTMKAHDPNGTATFPGYQGGSQSP